MSALSTGSRATRREWIGLAVLALPCVVYAMDLTVLTLAVPSLSADLRPSSTQLLWIVDIYGFTLAGSLITMGTLGDRIGRRRLLMWGAAAFGIVSVLAAYASSAPMLIAARAALGLAGATLAPSTLSLIRTMFLDAHQRTVAIGVWVTSFSAGAAIGPVLGGAMLERFWWGSVFLLAVPAMALLLAVGPRLLPEFRDCEAGRLDLGSAGLSLAAVLAVIYGLKQMAQHGLGWLPALCVATGLTLGVAFIGRQRTLRDPLIDLRLFRGRAFSAAFTTYTLGIFVVFGTDVMLGQYLQLVLGLSPWRAGLWSAPAALGFVAGSLVAPLILRRVRSGLVMAAGLAQGGIGFLLLTRLGNGSGLAVVVTGSVIASTGLALVFTLATDVVVGAAPPERAGAASAISETGAELGGAMGIAILGTVGTAVYRSQVPETAPAPARETLAGAVRVTAGLSDSAGAPLLAAARAAFTHGVQVGAGISAAIMLACAGVALVLLRRAGADDEAAPAHEPAARVVAPVSGASPGRAAQ